MKPEEQQIEIAKACGWNDITRTGTGQLVGCYGPLRGYLPLPDYRNDLNACQEMEKHLKTFKEMDDYANWLTEFCWKKTWEFRTWNCTAAQRCEAFLRVKGLWKEG